MLACSSWLALLTFFSTQDHLFQGGITHSGVGHPLSVSNKENVPGSYAGNPMGSFSQLRPLFLCDSSLRQVSRSSLAQGLYKRCLRQLARSLCRAGTQLEGAAFKIACLWHLNHWYPSLSTTDSKFLSFINPMAKAFCHSTS